MKRIYLLLLAPALLTSCAVENVIVSAPLVKTYEPQNVQDTYAGMGGYVFNDAGSHVTERGIVLSTTNPVPTVDDIKAVAGTGEGEFYGVYTGLEDNVTYYYRAFGTNATGTGYGDVMSFSTLPSTCYPETPNQVTTGGTTINVSGVTKETNWAIYDNGNIRFYTRGSNYVITLQFNETYQALPATGTYKTTQIFTNHEPSSDWKVKVYISTNGQPNEGILAPDGEYIFVQNINNSLTFTFCDTFINETFTLNGKFNYGI